MRHVRMLGLCLIATLAIAAVVTSSASALPEWGKCVKTGPGGKYSDANCTVKAKKGAGEYTWKKGAELAPVPFAGESVGSGGVLSTAARECVGGTYSSQRVTRAKCLEGGGEEAEAGYQSEIKIECSKENNTGEAVGKNQIANVHVTFKGCQIFGSAPCTGYEEGLEEGEIKTKTLKGTLGYPEPEGKQKHEAAVLLEPAAKGKPFAEFSCLGGFVKTVVGVGNKNEGAVYEDGYPPAGSGKEHHGGYDGIISPITPVNTMTTEYTQVYTVDYEKEENIPNKLQGKHISLLEDYLELGAEVSLQWGAAGEEVTNVNTATEAGEIKA